MDPQCAGLANRNIRCMADYINLSFFNLLVCYFIPRWTAMCGTSPNHQLIRRMAGLLYQSIFLQLVGILFYLGRSAMYGTSQPPTYRCIAVALSIYLSSTCWYVIYPQVDPAMCGTSPNHQLIRCMAGLYQSIFLQLVGMLFYPSGARNVGLARPATYRCMRFPLNLLSSTLVYILSRWTRNVRD